MNGRERFLTALRGGIPDRVPLFETHFRLPFICELLGPDVCPYHNVDDEVAMARATGLDAVWSAVLGVTSFSNIQLHGERYQDEWGTWYGSDENSWPGSWMENTVVNSRADWDALEIPDPHLPARMAQPARAVELVDGELAVVGAVRGPFSGAWMAAGMVNMSNWVYRDPALLDDILREMARWSTEIGLHLIETGVDAVMIHDDWGMNMGMMIKPEQWRQYVLPHIKRQVTTLADAGVPVILHSDGNLNVIMDDIAAMPISGFNPVQRNAGMDLGRIKAKYGDRICPIGNISASLTLPHRSADHVELQVLECLRDAAPGGGYIMAPDHSYHSAIPSENIWRVFNTCKEYGRYPLDMDAIQARIAELTGMLGPELEDADSSAPASDPIKNRPTTSGADEIFDAIYEFTIDGDKAPVIEQTEHALALGFAPELILYNALIPALEEVGRLFELGEYFVPEMLMAAQAMQGSMEILAPLIAATGAKPASTFVMGTVKGDIHDIGKNLCNVMLEGGGFEVIDLGVNVPVDTFVEAVREHKPDFLGMSAFLTTTMPMFKPTIEALEAAGLRENLHIFVGGAPVTDEFARKVGADGFASNGSQLNRMCKEILANHER